MFKSKYQIKKGAVLKELLALAEVSTEADLRKLKDTAKLRNGQVIKVPKLAMLRIYLEGAVDHPRSLYVQKGTRLVDLLDKVKFAEGADLKILNRKRRLKDEEVIHIPLQKPLLQ